MYGKGLRSLSIVTVAAMALALSLVFFYAPLEAEQGFLQKIFYLHVPLAIIALCGFVVGALFAIAHLRTRDSRWDMRSYVAIHMSLIFAVGSLHTHQCPHEPFAQIEPVTSAPTAKIRLMWIAT